MGISRSFTCRGCVGEDWMTGCVVTNVEHDDLAGTDLVGAVVRQKQDVSALKCWLHRPAAAHEIDMGIIL